MATLALSEPSEQDAVQDSPEPETHYETTDGKPYTDNYSNLSDDRVAELRQVLQAMNNRDQWARMVEIIRVTLRRYFWLGIQHGFWNADSQQFQVGPTGGTYGGENLNQEDLFAEDFNIYTPSGKIFLAQFSQSAASSRAEPDKPLDPDSVKAAAEAEKYVKVYQKYNDPKNAQIAVGKLLWTDGRVVAITENSPNGELFGYDTDDTGKQVARSGEWTRYVGVLESKVPIVQRDFSKWPFCKVSLEHDICTLQEDNPEFAEKIKKGKAQNANDEIARASRVSTAENISQISSDTIAHLGTEDTWWLRPSAFREIQDATKRAFWTGEAPQSDDEDDEGAEQPEPGLFPNGCKVKFIGDVYCGMSGTTMDDEVRCMHAKPGEGNSRPSLSDEVVPIQMEFNDALNMMSECLHKCIGRLWIDADAEEIAAIMEQISKYGEVSPYERKTGEAMEANFYEEQGVQPPAFMKDWIENLQGPLLQFVTGQSAATWGQQMEDQKTAHGYEQARDMANGLLSIVWGPYMQFAAAIRGQAARRAAKRDDKISVMMDSDNGKTSPLTVDPQVMRGGFLFTAVTDQSFPESWTELSNTWKGLMQAAPSNPIIGKSMQLPDNIRGFIDATGLKDDFVMDGADASDLQLAEWSMMIEDGGPVIDEEATQQRDQMRQQQAKQAAAAIAQPHIVPGASPMQPPPAPTAAEAPPLPPLPQLPPVLRSTVPIDPDTDDHVAHFLEMMRILNSPEGQKIKHAAPTEGASPLGNAWQNGKLHAMAHKAQALKMGLQIPQPYGPPPMPALPMPKPGAAVPPPTGAPPPGP